MMIKTTKEINWEHFNKDIPIMELCDLLGIEIEANNFTRCPSPDHEDDSPSCQINVDKNTYHCYACGESGSPLNLVLAKKYKLSADGYKQLQRTNRRQANDALYGAIDFLEANFPGGVMKQEVKTGEIPVPEIPKEVLKAVGLRVNPILYGQEIRVEDTYLTGKGHGIASQKMVLINTDDYFPTKTDKAGFLYDKLLKKEDNIRNYALKIFSDFPELDENAVKVIKEKTNKKIAALHVYTLMVKDYYFKQSEIDFPEEDIFEEKEQNEEKER